MERILKLNNLKNTYRLIEYGTMNFYEDNDDSGENWHDIRTVRYGLYESCGNYILLDKIRYENEEPDTMNIVIDAMNDNEYEQMCNELNTSKNSIVWLKQIYGTTTDVVFLERESGEPVNSISIRNSHHIDKNKKFQVIKGK
jgi:hypothetical protein